MSVVRKFDGQEDLTQDELLASEEEKRKAEREQEQKERELLAGILGALLMLRPMVVEYKVIAYLPWDQFRAALAGALSTGFVIHDIGALAAVARGKYDPLDPETIRQQQAYRDQFIAEYEAETRKAMQYAVMWAKVRGLDDVQANALLAKIAGINSVQMGAILRQFDSRKEAGASDKALDRMLAQMANKMIKERARMTAQSEGWRLFHLGQFAAMAQVERKFNVDAFKAWNVTPDERLCKFCMAIPGMNPNPIPLRQPFVTTKGPIMFAPAHPVCRCWHDWSVRKRGAF